MLQIKSVESVEVHRIKQLILKAGDDGIDTFKKDIAKIVELLAEYYQQNKQEIRDGIVQAFILSISHLPLKAGIYATMLALLSSKQNTQPLADLIIQGVLDQLQYISTEATPVLGETLMKFLGELMNVGLLNTVSFVECLYDLEGGAESESSPFYLQILLSTIPHTMIKALEKNQIEFKNIIQNVEVLMTKRKQKDRLFYLWQAIRNFLNSNQDKDTQTFMKLSYPRPYYLFPEEMAQVKQIRKNFKIPIVKRTQLWNPQLIAVSATDQQESKDEMQMELTRQWLYQTIEIFKSNRMQLLFQLKTYERCMRLSPTQEQQLKQLIVYTIMNMLVDQTPRSNQPSSIFFSGFLNNLELGEKGKEWYDIIDSFVDQLNFQNLYVIEQLSDFLSHVIANSSLSKINWDKLHSRINTNEDETGFFNNYFTTQVYRKLFALVTIDKVKDLIPQELSDWYANQVDVTIPIEVKEAEISSSITEWLQKKTSAAEMIENLEGLVNEDMEKRVTVFLEGLMTQMAKSITHLTILSKRYLPLLLQPKIITQEKLGELFLSTLYNMWAHSLFHLQVYLKEFLAMEVVSSLQIVRWMVSMIAPKIRYQDYEDSAKQINIIIAVNNILRKCTFLEPSQDLQQDGIKEMLIVLHNFTKTTNDQILIGAVEYTQNLAIILMKQGNIGQAEKIAKDLNQLRLIHVIQSF